MEKSRLAAPENVNYCTKEVSPVFLALGKLSDPVQFISVLILCSFLQLVHTK